MKIGIIGIGNMGSAIIERLVAENKWEILVTAKRSEKLRAFAKQHNVSAIESTLGLVEMSDIVLIAVKPHIFPEVLKEIRTALKQQKKVIVSIAAGLTLEQLRMLTKVEQQAILRVMPNVAALVGESTTALVANKFVSTEALKNVKEIFEACGRVYEMEEKDFSSFIALAGSSPAMVFMLIDAMSRAGVKHGINKQVATDIATQAVLGSAKLLGHSKENPWNLIDKVSSPGGTTVAGVLALEEAGFLSAITKGMDAIIDRDKEMSKNLS